MDLKPCPFCGCTPAKVEASGDPTGWTAWIKCSGKYCAANPQVIANGRGSQSAENYAIARWNTRMTPSATVMGRG